MPTSLRQAYRKASSWVAARTGFAWGGAFPDVLIIGAQKAGTTSLFRYLEQHPSISVSYRKEVHFFDKAFDQGKAWYRRQFPRRRKGQVVLEATPYYLFYPPAAERAAALLPSAKLIVLLREPVARAFSNYQHEIAWGRETLSFEDAIAAEPERLGDCQERLARGEIAQSFAHQYCAYLSRGFYADQIERWLAFYPASQFLFLKAEEMFTSPQRTFERVCDFLGLPPCQLADATPRYQRSYAPLSDQMREKRERLYEEPNRRVAELTGISWEQEERPAPSA